MSHYRYRNNYTSVDKYLNLENKPISHLSQTTNPELNLHWSTQKYANTSDPRVWGPAFWFSLHNGAAYSPEHPDRECMKRIKGFINGIPEMLPCEVCSQHARKFIDSNQKFMDKICISRNNLFNFYVDFHNYVNKRHNKPTMSYQDARKLYTHTASVSKLSY